jgi:serine/threonine-protein kinase
LAQDDSASGAAPSPPSRSDPPIADESLDLSVRYTAGELVGGNYRLIRLSGQGGMGDVWLAHNEVLDIDVAVKLIRTASSDGEAEDRLLREAQSAAKLGHPAIVRIFDFGRTDLHQPFIVMEWLEGEDLGTALERRGRLSAAKAVATLLPIVHALAAAHAKGIVHRDLKPENVFLARLEGEQLQPKIVDFGIAKIDHSKGVRLTQAGELLGSPAYMSPEQARGEEVDHRADIWSLCVVLYETAAGRRPFEGKNHNAILQSIISDAPLPLAQLEAADDALWGILSKGLSKDPSARWPSMRALGEALAGWLLSNGISEDITGASLASTWLQGGGSGDKLGTVPPPSSLPAAVSFVSDAETLPRREGVRQPTSRRRVLVAAVAVVALALAGGLVIWGGPRSGPVSGQVGPIPGAAATAPAPVAPPAPSVPPEETARIRVETLDRIPVDGRGGATDAKKVRWKPSAPGVIPHRPVAAGAPKPTLKDPFQ